MNRIKLLTKDIYDKIAAGEVIESPLSVVKELVENSIDSGASQIVIDIKEGGKDYIRVSDNGSGIYKEDLKLSILPHATSKIRFAEDLSNILSLGFRGEALSSIAAVSNLEIVSKTEDDKIGARICVSGSEITEESETACETGTSVIVKDLFFNIPARRKFLKSDMKENTAISDFVSKISLAYPNIKFRFICDNTIRFSTPGKGDIYQTILTVYSPQNARKLLKLSYDKNNISIKGYISSPLESRNNRKHQIFFVNGRLITSELLESAVKNAYSDKLFEGRFPSVYLFYDIEPNTVDVNIHPRKAEIKFLKEQDIFDCTIEAIRETLLDKNATAIESMDIEKKNISTSIKESTLDNKPEESKKEEVKYVFTMPSESDNTLSEGLGLFKDLRLHEEISQTKEEQIKEEFDITINDRFMFSSLKPVAQLFTTYIIAKDDDNMYIIDQHAAHERVMYEKLLNSFNAADKAGQILLTPMIIELDKSKIYAAENSLPILYDMGFSLELFGNSSYLVKEIPYFMEADEAETFIYEFIDSADDYKNNIQLKRDQIISRSCKSAVKAHDKLTNEEILSLFHDMDKCENPYSCPHGRPTFIKLSEYELEKMFKRK